jgi:hypothetical protein
VALLVCPLAGRLAGAQAVAGSGDDAIPLPRGTTRISVGGLWNDHADRFVARGGANGRGPLRREPLLAALATEQAGSGLFPQLLAAEGALRSLTGNSALQLSLGPLQALGDVRQSIAPIVVERGLTRRLGIRLVVPYVESRDNAQLLLNRSGTGATVGVNPAFGASGAAARLQNGALLQAVDSARGALSAAIVRCQGSAATGCDAIRGDLPGALATAQRAGVVRAALATVYGTATQGGAPVVPVKGSALETAVTGALATLRTDLSRYGITPPGAALTPAAATTVLGPGGVPAMAADSSWRLPYQRFGNTRRAGIGDIDLWATWLLVDSDQGDVRRRLLGNQRAVRTLVGVGWRFGTAGADRTEDALDVPIGEGANALLLRASTDLVLNRSAWLTTTVRATRPFGDDVATVVPARDIAQLFTPFRTAVAARALGMRLEAEVMPRSVHGATGLGGTGLGARLQPGPPAMERARTDAAFSRGRTHLFHAGPRPPWRLPAGRGGVVPACASHCGRWAGRRAGCRHRPPGTTGLHGVSPPLAHGRAVVTVGFAPGQQLAGVRAADLAVGIAPQHPRHLLHPGLSLDRHRVRGGDGPHGPLAHHHVVMGARRNLRQVRDGQHLMMSRHASQQRPHLPGHGPPDAGVDLVKHQRGHLLPMRQHRAQRQHDA